MEFTVFVKVDESGRIVDINSSMFLQNTAGWVEIAKGIGDAFQHAQGNYMPKPIFNIDGIPIYKMEMGEIRERSEEEIQADIKPQGKTPFENMVDRLDKLEKSLTTITTLLAKLGVK